MEPTNDFIKSPHAETLNALVDMQESLIYAARRPVLNAAENIIVKLERELATAQKELADVRSALLMLTVGGSEFFKSDNTVDTAAVLTHVRERFQRGHAANCDLALAKKELATLGAEILRLTKCVTHAESETESYRSELATAQKELADARMNLDLIISANEGWKLRYDQAQKELAAARVKVIEECATWLEKQGEHFGEWLADEIRNALNPTGQGNGEPPQGQADQTQAQDK